MLADNSKNNRIINGPIYYIAHKYIKGIEKCHEKALRKQKKTFDAVVDSLTKVQAKAFSNIININAADEVT